MNNVRNACQGKFSIVFALVVVYLVNGHLGYFVVGNNRRTGEWQLHAGSTHTLDARLGQSLLL